MCVCVCAYIKCPISQYTFHIRYKNRKYKSEISSTYTDFIFKYLMAQKH